MVHWDGETATTVIDTVAQSGGASVELGNYAGVNPPNIPFADVARLGLSGAILGATLRYGHQAGALGLIGNEVIDFNSFLRPNLDARTATGNLDWVAKAYVAADLDGGLSVLEDTVIGFYNRHVISMA